MNYNKELIKIKTLYKSEVKRIFKTFLNQTILAPVVNAMLFVMVFSSTIGRNIKVSDELDYINFLIIGVSMMAAIQGSFSNGSSTLVTSKMCKSINDYLIPPFNISSIIFGLSSAAMTRGAALFFLAYSSSSILFTQKIILPENIIFLFLHIFISLLFSSLLGILFGLICNSFEKLTSVNSYIVMPLTFISGTFYSTKSMNYTVLLINKAINPFFYSINGVRYGIAGYSSTNIFFGFGYLSLLCIIIWTSVFIILKKGFFIKT